MRRGVSRLSRGRAGSGRSAGARRARAAAGAPRPRPRARRAAGRSRDRRERLVAGPPRSRSRASSGSGGCAWRRARPPPRAPRGGEHRLPDLLDAARPRGRSRSSTSGVQPGVRGAADGGRPGSRPRPGARRPASSPSALLITTRSASSMMPRLMPCSSSPPPGASSTRSSRPCPRPRSRSGRRPRSRSRHARSPRPRRRAPPRGCAVRRRPAWPPAGEGRMNACGRLGQPLHAGLVAEDRAARCAGSRGRPRGPRSCGPRRSRGAPKASMKVDLPAPGVPEMPSRTAWPVAGSRRSSNCSACAWWSGRRNSISVIARASARRSPASTRSARVSRAGVMGTATLLWRAANVNALRRAPCLVRPCPMRNRAGSAHPAQAVGRDHARIRSIRYAAVNLSSTIWRERGSLRWSMRPWESVPDDD